MRSATASTPWLLVMWLCTLLVTGSACSRQFRPPVSREDFWSCCSGVEDCFAVLQDAEAPGLDPSIHWYRVAPEVICASYGLRVADKRGEIFPRLVALLSDPSPRVRDAAAYVLSEMHGPAHDVVPILLEFHEKHPRSQALAELVKLDDLRAAPLLRQYLQEGVTQPSLPCLNDRLAPVLLEELENPESPVWARAGPSALLRGPRFRADIQNPRAAAARAGATLAATPLRRLVPGARSQDVPGGARWVSTSCGLAPPAAQIRLEGGGGRGGAGGARSR